MGPTRERKNRKRKDRLDNEGVSSIYSEILITLAINGPMTVRDLHAEMDRMETFTKSYPALSTDVVALEETGYIRNTGKSQRENYMRLTEKGENWIKQRSGTLKMVIREMNDPR